LGTVWESELYGGVLTSALGWEHFALTAEFLWGDECVLLHFLQNYWLIIIIIRAFFLNILSSFVTSAKFA
jgi:hypothetical protein